MLISYSIAIDPSRAAESLMGPGGQSRGMGRIDFGGYAQRVRQSFKILGKSLTRSIRVASQTY